MSSTSTMPATSDSTSTVTSICSGVVGTLEHVDIESRAARQRTVPARVLAGRERATKEARLAGKFQIRSRKWDIGILIGVDRQPRDRLRRSVPAAGRRATRRAPRRCCSSIFLGVVTFLLFAGPGIVYVLRKRVKPVKDALPGGTMAWIRSAPLPPGAGAGRRLRPRRGRAVPRPPVVGQGPARPRRARVGRRPRPPPPDRHPEGGPQRQRRRRQAHDRPAARLPPPRRRLHRPPADPGRGRRRRRPDGPVAAGAWAKIKELTDEVEKHFPREGGQRWHIRQYKLWRALHPPLTIALFLVLAFHVWDVLGGTRAVAGDEEQFASASECAGCHSDTFKEWAGSTMAHAATSTINEAQLPITLVGERPHHRGVRRHGRPWRSSPGATSMTTARRSSSSTTPRCASTATRRSAAASPTTRWRCCPFGEGDSPVSGNDAVHERRRRLHRLPHPGGPADRAARAAASRGHEQPRRRRRGVRSAATARCTARRSPTPTRCRCASTASRRPRATTRRGLLAQRHRDVAAVRRVPQRQARHGRRRR